MGGEREKEKEGNIWAYNCPLVSAGDWFQDASRILKPADAQVPYIIWGSTVGPPDPRMQRAHCTCTYLYIYIQNLFVVIL